MQLEVPAPHSGSAGTSLAKSCRYLVTGLHVASSDTMRRGSLVTAGQQCKSSLSSTPPLTPPWQGARGASLQPGEVEISAPHLAFADGGGVRPHCFL